ncbi:alanine dehydrogenase [Thiotrichales bacterium 19S9-12]|nr:alanine dehydrogenase [Thiotrichales bacterium 19S9-11]MCF6812388.1 alanine dehydrogenase [Thiotrichales bacterium 19S9-12]
MIIGVPKEIKNREYRVGLTPGSVRELVHHGHQVMIEKNAGDAIGFHDYMYIDAGATTVDTAKEIFDKADMIVKVKEPQANECKMLREGQVLFTYLHLAPDPQQTKLLVESNSVAIAYETVTDDHGRLPLLTPMSEVAGRLSIQAGAHCLERAQGGSGVLLGGVPGVKPADVVVIGGGIVGLNAIRMAIGMEARVTVLERSIERLKELDDYFGPKLNTIYSTVENLDHYITNADLVIGAVLIPGAQAPKLVTRDMLKRMKQGSVVVDVAIDQGGCFETSRPTTHDEPTFIEEGVVHYCVANMPGAVARTSTIALNNATLPFVLKLANLGYKDALLMDEHLRNGLNVHHGQITCEAVAEALNYNYIDPKEAISQSEAFVAV